jgi:hypothetical protein
MRPLSLDRSAKGWLISSLLVLLIFLVVFSFRKYFSETIVLWVVLLTPVVLLILALLFGKFSKNSRPFQ